MKLNILNPWQWKNQRSKAINEKTSDQSYDSGCIMGYFDLTEYNVINQEEDEISESDIYNDEENTKGREIEPHVTILYGLSDSEIDEDDVILLLQSLKMPIVELTEISCFTNDEFDVLKYDVQSDALNLYNSIVTSLFPYKSKFPDYHAHLTIAYMNPGSGKKYSKKISIPKELKVLKWVYSQSNGRKISIDMDGNMEVIREADDKKIKENVSITPDNENYEYKGYLIKLEPTTRFKGSYFCSVWKDGEYKMGLKGPVRLDDAKKSAELFINGQLTGNE